MSPDRPINADVPPAGEPTPPLDPKPAAATAPTEGEETARETKPAAQPKPPRPPKAKRRRRKPIPGALKGIAALVVVAIAFIVAAVIGGSGGSKDSTSAAPAPTPATRSAAAEAPASQTSEALGYPAFATGNTTRVGGSDPATNAAGVALAVFPSTTPAQRPAAVTLVAEDDWAGAIAASVLMSAPVRAPVLISNADGLPDPTAEALEALDPQGDKSTGGVTAFAVGGVATPDGGKTRVIKAGDAATTAAAIAELRDDLFGSAPAHYRNRPLQPARAGDAGRGLGGPLRRSGSLRRRRRAAGRDPRRPRAAQEGSRLRARARHGDLRESADGDQEGFGQRPPGRRQGRRRQRDRLRPLHATAASAGTSTTPVTASSSPATTRRSTPPSPPRSRPPVPGARCCSATAPLPCRRRYVNTSST